MFKSVEELKEFIIWSKSQGLKRVRVGDTEIEISDIYIATMAASEPSITQLPKNTEENDSIKTLLDTEISDPKEDEDLLYWSTKG